MNKNFKYTAWWITWLKYPTLLVTILMPFFILIPVSWYLFSGQLIIDLPILNGQTEGWFFKYIGPVVFTLNGLNYLTVYADIEIKGDKFRIKTWLNRERWYSFDEIRSVGTPSKSNSYFVVEMDHLPTNFRVKGLQFFRKHPQFQVWKHIDGYDELKDILSQNQTETC